jgi:hypothetical protein
MQAAAIMPVDPASSSGTPVRAVAQNIKGVTDPSFSLKIGGSDEAVPPAPVMMAPSTTVMVK